MITYNTTETMFTPIYHGETRSQYPHDGDEESGDSVTRTLPPPITSDIAASFSPYHSSTPARPVSPKRQHMLDVSYPVSYPVSYLRTPLPQHLDLQVTRWKPQHDVDGFREAHIPIWEGCLPDDDVLESVELEHAEVLQNAEVSDMCAGSGQRIVDMGHFQEDSALAPTKREERQGLKRPADNGEDEVLRENDDTGRKKLKC